MGEGVSPHMQLGSIHKLQLISLRLCSGTNTPWRHGAAAITPVHNLAAVQQCSLIMGIDTPQTSATVSQQPFAL
jgi:hypothetical protein